MKNQVLFPIIAISILSFSCNSKQNKAADNNSVVAYLDNADNEFRNAKQHALLSGSFDIEHDTFTIAFLKAKEISEDSAMSYAKWFSKLAYDGYNFKNGKYFIDKKESDTNYYLDNLTNDSKDILIEKLKKKFIIKNDNFNGGVIYYHKNNGTNVFKRRKCIYAEIRYKELFLYSNYYSNNWIFHTNISVKIGENIINSQNINKYDKNYRTDVNDGNVFENIAFGIPESSNILRAIAMSNEPVLIRFNGDQYYSEIKLSSTDRNSLKDAYDLYLLLNK